MFKRRKNGRKNRKNRKRGNLKSDINDQYGIEHADTNNYGRDDSSSSFHRDTSYINSGNNYITMLSQNDFFINISILCLAIIIKSSFDNFYFQLNRIFHSCRRLHLH